MGWPMAIIAGAPRCGTTSIFQMLSEHPQICASSVKETRFFVDPGYPLEKRIARFDEDGIDSYGRFFEHCDDDTVRLEATPDYLYQRTALEQIPDLKPTPHVVIVLRQPTDRVLSVFRFAKGNFGWFDQSLEFPEFVRRVKSREGFGNAILDGAIEQSRYVRHLRSFRDALPKGHLHVFVLEKVAADPTPLTKRLSEALGIEESLFAEDAIPQANPSIEVRNVALHRVARRFGLGLAQRSGIFRWARDAYKAINIRRDRSEPPGTDELAEVFVEDNERLAAEFGLDLSTWKL